MYILKSLSSSFYLHLHCMSASPLKPIQLFINWDFTSRLIILLACMLNIRGYGSSFFQKSFPFDISVGSVARLMIFKCFFISWYRCRDMNSWMRYNKIFADQYSCSFGNRANPIRSRIPRKISISAPVIYLHLGVREHGSCAKLCLAALIFVFAAMLLRVINSWKSCNGRSKEVNLDLMEELLWRYVCWYGLARIYLDMWWEFRLTTMHRLSFEGYQFFLCQWWFIWFTRNYLLVPPHSKKLMLLTKASKK